MIVWEHRESSARSTLVVSSMFEQHVLTFDFNSPWLCESTTIATPSQPWLKSGQYLDVQSMIVWEHNESSARSTLIKDRRLFQYSVWYDVFSPWLCENTTIAMPSQPWLKSGQYLDVQSMIVWEHSENSARSTLIMDRIFWYFDEEVNFTPKAVGPSGGAATKLPGKKVLFLTMMRIIYIYVMVERVNVCRKVFLYQCDFLSIVSITFRQGDS